MVELTGSILQAGSDIFGLQVGKVAEDGLLGFTRCEHIEHIFDPDAHASDARAPSALVWIKGDSFELAHVPTLPGSFWAASLASRSMSCRSE